MLVAGELEPARVLAAEEPVAVVQEPVRAEAVVASAVEAEASPVEAVDLVAVSVEDWARFSVWEAWVLLPLQSLTTTITTTRHRSSVQLFRKTLAICKS